MSRRTPNSFENFSASVAAGGDLRGKSVRGAFFMATAGAIEFAARFGGILVLARILDPEDFGLIAMVTAFTGFVEIFKDLGLGAATIQRETITHQEISSLFWINALCGGFVALAFCAISPAISWFYGDSRLIAVTAALATTLLWGGMAIQHEALLSRQLRQGTLAFIRLLATLLSLSLGIALALKGFGYWALVAREVARSLILLFGVWWFCQWIPALLLRLNDVRDQLRFGRDLTLTNIIMGVVGKIDGVLIGKFFGPAVLGVYRQAYSLIMLPIEQFNVPVFSVAQPSLSALQSDPARYKRYFHRIAGSVSLITMPLGVFAAIYSEEITFFVLGNKWLPVSPFLGVFAIAAALFPTLATSAIVLMTLGRSKVLLGLALSHSLILVLMMIVGLRWGALGVASAHVATGVLFIPPRLYYGFKGSPISFKVFFSAIRMPLASSIFMGVSLLAFRFVFPIAHPIVSLFAGCGIGAAMYLLPWLLLSSGRAELRLILRDVQSALMQRSAQGLPNMVIKPQ